MKVQFLAGIIGYPNQLREKKHENSKGNVVIDLEADYESPDQQSGGEEFSQELDEETLNQALESFQAENALHGAGIKAARVGDGPGLKILLQDSHGVLIKQFTGEEFLKLRQSAQLGPHVRGKILDHKL